MTKDLPENCGWRRALTRVAVVAGVTLGGLASFGTAQAAEPAGEVTPTIIGGQPADQTYSFMVSLQWEKDGDLNSHRCGGALIRNDWVVTAAHCVTLYGGTGTDNYTIMDPALFHVRVGSKDRTTGGTVANVKNIVVNPDWSWLEEGVVGADVALLQLDTAVVQRTIPTAATDTEPGTKVRELGWGYLSNDDRGDPSKLPVQLQQLDTTIIPPTTPKCIADPVEGGDFGIREGDVCADNVDGVRGTCGGDSGSPLLRLVDGRWQLVGVDSRVVTEACAAAPDIYTSMSYFSSWIDGVTG